MVDPRSLGPALERLRQSRGLTQKEVAERIGCSDATVLRIEQPGANPKASLFLRYLDAIGASLSDLDAEI